MDLTKEVTDAIEKQLPAQVGDVLRKRLEQAERDARALAEAKLSLERHTIQAANLSARIAELEGKLEKHGDLAKREEAVLQRERNAEINDLKTKLEAEQRFGQQVATALQGLVRNVEYRNNWSGMQGFAAPQPGGGYGMQTATVGVGGSGSTGAA